MKEGFYSIRFAGAADFGFGILAFDSGVVCGVDSANVFYDGTYRYDDVKHKIVSHIDLTVPPGVALVQGVPPQSQVSKLTIDVELDRELGSEHPITIQTPYGPVAIVFKKIRDFSI